MSRLGVILSQFPRYDEAFILRDLQALKQGQEDMVIFSLRPCRDKIVHAQAKALLPQTVYAPFFLSLEVWKSQFFFLKNNPAAYWSGLRWIVSRHWRNPVILFKTLIFFPKTTHFARIGAEKGLQWIHAGWATYPATSALIMAELLSVPYSVAGHAHDIHTVNPALIEKMRRAKFVVTCTEANKAFLDELDAKTNANGLGKANVVVSYHGVDLSRFAAVQKQPSAPCKIVVVGSLLPCKGLETLIDACLLLKQRAFPFHCTIAGGGPLEKKLRKQVADASLEQNVTITGFVTQEQVVAFYQQAHIFALPLISKIHWGIPNVLIEALATKTTVICCELPSLKELVQHMQTGWIIPEQDPHAIVKAVETLWSDAPLRERLAQAGHQRVIERFSLERTGVKLRALFDGVSAVPNVRSPWNTLPES